MADQKPHKKILILTSKVGGGHLSIAETYKQIIIDNLPRTEILVLITSLRTSWLYRFTTGYMAATYSKIWKISDNNFCAKSLHYFYTFFAVKKVTSIIKKFKPDLIISTNAFSSTPADSALKSLGLKIPIIVVIADPFSIHKTLTYYRNGSLYLSPTEEAGKIFRENGISKDRIRITGWPVRKEFYRRIKEKKDTKIRVLMTAGGEGLSYARGFLIECLKNKSIRENFHFSVVCARNKELHLSLQLIKKIYPESLDIFEFVHDIDVLMRNSDIVVGKAGPNFLFETITMMKPFIAIGEPIGQEAGNYEFILKNRIGKHFKSPREFKNYLLSFMNGKNDIDPKKLNYLSKIQLKTPDKIWSAIKSYLN